MSDAPRLPGTVTAELRKSRCYQTTAAPDQILAEFVELKSFDKMAEGKIKQWMWLTISSFLLAIVLLISLPGNSIGFLVLAPSTFFIFQWVAWAKKNLADERYLLAERLLELFARDQDENDPVALRIGFDKINRKETMLRKTRDRTIYKDTWLSMSGKFADGSKFSLKIEQIMHVKFRKGKEKQKGYVVSLTTAFSRKQYGLLQLNKAKANAAIQVSSKARLKSVKVKGNVLQICAALPLPLGLPFKTQEACDELSQLITLMLLSSYEVLRTQSHTASSNAS